MSAEEEGFPYWGKRAQRFLGKSRWTIQRYQNAGLLPAGRTCFSKGELLACVEKLTRKKRPGAAERINMRRAAAKAATNKNKSKAAAVQQETPSTVPPVVAEKEPDTEPVAPSPAPSPNSAETGGAGAYKAPVAKAPIPTACDGEDDPHHVNFPKGKGWPKTQQTVSAGPETPEPPSDMGWGWDFNE